jgi:hypothetical protein
MSEWKPIDKRTPNYTDMLVHYSNGKIGMIEADDNDYKWKPYDSTKPRIPGVASPTHWMPLPPPPESNT